jgi:hypothetical protein
VLPWVTFPLHYKSFPDGVLENMLEKRVVGYSEGGKVMALHQECVVI